MTEERNENYFGMKYGQGPRDISSIRARFEDPASAQMVFEAEKYMREIAAGRRELGDEPEMLGDPNVLEFLTQGRPEFGGRSILASLRTVIDQEKVRGFFVNPEDIPAIKPVETTIPEAEIVEVVVPQTPDKKRINNPHKTRRSLARGTSEGREWVGIGHFLGIGIPHKALDEILKQIPSRETPWGSTSYTAYNRVSAEAAIKTYMESHPRIPKESDIVVFDDSQWVNLTYLKNRFGLSYTGLQGLLGGLASKKGRGKLGSEVALYNLAEAVEILEKYSALPTTDPATGVLEDSGTTWVPIRIALERLNVSYSVIAEHLPHIGFKMVRARGGKEVKAYDENAIKSAISDSLSTPKVGDSTTPTNLVSADFLANRFNLHRNTVHKRLKGIAKPVRGRNGKPSSYYNLSEAETLLSQ